MTTAFKGAKLNTVFVTLGRWLSPRVRATLSPGEYGDVSGCRSTWISGVMPPTGWRLAIQHLMGLSLSGYAPVPHASGCGFAPVPHASQ